MDTVYNNEFKLEFQYYYLNGKVYNTVPAVNFAQTLEEYYNTDEITISIKENLCVSVIFDSKDSEARLYLEGFDGVVGMSEFSIDEQGDIYKKPSNTAIKLYDSENYICSLRVGYYKIKVVCNNKNYYGTLRISPGVLGIDEWQTMKNELENEMTGLAQDIIRRYIGLGKDKQGNMPPKQMLKYIIINKYSKDIFAALTDIKDNPRNNIITRYIEVPEEEVKNIDGRTIKNYLQNKNRLGYYSVPTKVVNYDIAENRFLKKVILIYEREIKLLETSIEKLCEHYREQCNCYTEAKNAEKKLITFETFLSSIRKCKKVTNVIKQEKWYKSVSMSESVEMTHSLAMDSRYAILYRFYCELRKDSFKVEIDQRYSYGWKISSNLYEMWCYIKLFRLFDRNFERISDNFTQLGTDNIFFSFLEKGTTVAYKKGNLMIKLVFDKLVPTTGAQTDKENSPIFMSSDNPLRPDIAIHMYNIEQDAYIGSIILECKYRKIKNFWDGNKDFASRTQIRNYKHYSTSKYYRNMPEDMAKSFKPAIKVYALNPDDKKELKDDEAIVLNPFKPGHDLEIQAFYEELTCLMEKQITNNFGFC